MKSLQESQVLSGSTNAISFEDFERMRNSLSKIKATIKKQSTSPLKSSHFSQEKKSLFSDQKHSKYSMGSNTVDRDEQDDTFFMSLLSQNKNEMKRISEESKSLLSTQREIENKMKLIEFVLGDTNREYIQRFDSLEQNYRDSHRRFDEVIGRQDLFRDYIKNELSNMTANNIEFYENHSRQIEKVYKSLNRMDGQLQENIEGLQKLVISFRRDCERLSYKLYEEVINTIDQFREEMEQR
eukprot:TRINITY_DN1621_c0_g1_i2.p1 TRINITY_DN1621_c0_g1~~TRINITY_DN1621_c0_g1_i2.p1  ORF type:complete len:240 (-),score=53.19 TRINITY_DN1621_c0_g1_i2:170-889(-)